MRSEKQARKGLNTAAAEDKKLFRREAGRGSVAQTFLSSLVWRLSIYSELEGGVAV